MDTIKLLLVEDDPSLRYIVQSGLEDIIEGYEVLAAANGEEGLAMWREHRPDVILSDIEMPIMDGYEMVKRIREVDKETPIIFSSGLVSPISQCMENKGKYIQINSIYQLVIKYLD